MKNMLKITSSEFNVFAKYIYDVSGIMLESGKEYLIESRLASLAAKSGCNSFSELYRKAKVDSTKEVEKKIIDAISTNETYFFRDKSPFELLQYKILPDLIDRKHRKSKGNGPIQLRIWSAASSTGQEVYSIAIVLKNLNLDPKKYIIRLLGTDISNSAISKASYGRYNKFEITRGLPPEMAAVYFNQESDDFWRIKDEIRAFAVFRTMNLMEPFTGVGEFDVIFCRNVAIYFSQKDRQRLYNKIAHVLAPDGYLLIGSSESLVNETNLFKPSKYLKAIFYQLSSYTE